MTHAEIAAHFNCCADNIRKIELATGLKKSRSIACCAENIRKIERSALKKLAANPEVRVMFEEMLDSQGKETLWEAMTTASWGVDEQTGRRKDPERLESRNALSDKQAAKSPKENGLNVPRNPKDKTHWTKKGIIRCRA